MPQGDALGCRISPRWGWRVGVPSPIRHSSFGFHHSRPYLLFALFSKLCENPAQVRHDGFHFLHGAGGQDGGFREVGAGFGAVVLEPGDVEGVVPFGDPLAGELAEAAGLAGVLAFFQGGGIALGIGAEGFFEIGEVLAGERGALAELRHVGPEVIDPDFFGVVLVGGAPGEEEDVGFNALGVEDAGGETQDGVQVALVHEVAADVLADAGLKQNIVRQHHGGAASGQEVTVDVLEEAELFIAGGIGEIRAGGQAAAFFGAEGRIGQDEGGLGQGRAILRKGGPITDATDAMKHEIHHGEAVGILHMLHAIEGAVPVFFLLLLGEAERY